MFQNVCFCVLHTTHLTGACFYVFANMDGKEITSFS